LDIRHPRTIAVVLALLAATLLAPASAVAAHLRVEGPHRTIFQGRVRPLIGTLKGHTTRKATALGALVQASRLTPFRLGLKWFDGIGPGWAGFFVNSIAGRTTTATGFWGFKLGHATSSTGMGGTEVGRGSHILVYWTTFNSDTGATQPTLGLTSTDRTPAANSTVTFTVRQYDDAGTASTATGAWVWVNGAATHVDASGTVSLRFSRGDYRVRATEPGAIRSQTLWVHVS
jgi:hypothetical protein